ncbi:HNH endonuclease [bacterium]|nr:HNH endonuclease [bacterium]
MKTLHERAVALVKTYLRTETELISVLQEIDLCNGYRDLGFKSLFDYVRSLGLSDSVAYNFITISRKSVQVPALKERIQDQEISLSNAKVIVSILTPEYQDKWLQAAAQFPKRELEKIVAKEFPERSVKESTRYVAEERVELKLGISEALLKKLKRIQDLESKKSAASLEQALEAMADLYLQKNDPLEKAKRSKPLAPECVWKVLIPSFTRSDGLEMAPENDLRHPYENHRQFLGLSKHTPARVNKNPGVIPAHLHHAVQKRDQAQCTHVTQGKRCTERRWLDIHHKKPLSQGGETTLSNQALLCRGHHQLLHHKRP